MRTYRELFAVHEFRAIFIAQCLANAAAAAGSLALGTVTYAATGNAALTGLSMFGGPLIRLAASWFTSSAADLLRPRQALMAVAAVTCAADLLQALPGMPWGARFAFLALPWIAMAATSGSMLALVSDILPKDSYVFGRATINVAVGGMQVAGYGLGGLLLVALTTSGLFLAAAGAAAVALVVVYLGIGDHPPRVTGHSLMRRSHEVNRALLGSPLLRPVFLAGCLPNGLVVGASRCSSRSARTRRATCLPSPRPGCSPATSSSAACCPPRPAPGWSSRCGSCSRRRTSCSCCTRRCPRRSPSASSRPPGTRRACRCRNGYSRTPLPTCAVRCSACTRPARWRCRASRRCSPACSRSAWAAGRRVTAIGAFGCASLAVTVALIPGLRRTRPGGGARGADRATVTAGGQQA